MSPFRKRAALAVALTTFGAAAVIPGSALAAVDAQVSGDTLTVTSDDAADAITLTAVGGKLTVNGASTSLPADDNAKIVVNAGGGDDTVTVTLAAAEYGQLTVNGGAGDDLLTGGPDADALRGDDGDDRVVGAKGNDDMEGGAGNDVLVWNNGDNSDTMDGDAGADEVEVNGAATAGDQFTIVPNNGRVKFDRTNLVPFTLDVSTERMTVNGLGGDDQVTGAPGLSPFALTVNGGTGADTITGGDAGDVLNGGDDNDVLDGAGGTDRVSGDRGNDTMRGGDGDDALVWNNGDNNDVIDGDAGLDRVEVNGAPAGDVFTVAPNAGRVKFDRTNLVPFTLDTNAEALQVNGSAGDDQLTVAPGVAPLQAISADGGAGNDTLQGAEGSDSFFGGSGDDVLSSAGGFDVMDGQAGNDTITTRDDGADLVRGGDGADKATVDRLDVVDGVEALDVPAAPPAADTKALAARIATSRATVRRNAVRLALTCPAAESGGCKAVVTLTGTVRIGGQRIAAILGTKSVSLKAGQRRTVTVKVPKNLRRLARTSTFRVRASVVSTDAAGNVATSSRRITLALPKAR